MSGATFHVAAAAAALALAFPGSPARADDGPAVEIRLIQPPQLVGRADPETSFRTIPVAACRVEVVLSGGVATTTFDLTYRNDVFNTPIEGKLILRLPARAAVSRCEIEVGEALRPSSLAARAAARRAYDEVVGTTIEAWRERIRDPGLVEWVSPREVEARIFPIFPGASRRIVVAYDQAVEGRAGFALPRAAGGKDSGGFELKLVERPATAADGAKLERIEAAGRVEALLAAGGPVAEIDALARRYRLVTPLTSLIALEFPSDYVRYGVAPPPEFERVLRNVAEVVRNDPPVRPRR